MPVKTENELYPSKSDTAVEEVICIKEKKLLKNKFVIFGNIVGFTWLLLDDTN